MSATFRSTPTTATESYPALALAVRWEISPTALLVAAPARALFNGEAPRLVGAALVCHIRGPLARAELVLELPRQERRIVELHPPTPACLVHDTFAMHVEAPGLLQLSLSPDQPRRVLYARTALLTATLGLAGGVYDVPALVFPRS